MVHFGIVHFGTASERIKMEHRILLVDDDRDYLEVLKIDLVGAGFKNVTMEDNPLEPHICLRQTRPSTSP